MRTCPACGEDTKAGTVEPCTECGFSPVVGTPVEEEPTFETAPASFETGGTTEPVPQTEAPQSAPKKKTRRWTVLFWVLFAIGFGVADFGSLFDDPTGPSEEEVEAALSDWASDHGGTLTIDCPSDVEDTPVGGTFECTASNSRGQTAIVSLTNNENDFSWNGLPMKQLIRRDR